MRKIIAATAIATLGLTAAPALASDDDYRCDTPADATWMPIEEVAAKTQAMGYTLREVERDDGCYEIEATDANGMKVEFKMHPVSGEVVRRGDRS
ncbi:PepSY domain-containing protein [Aquibium sp. A9E412]|uniref:PepSY domain-containing protein n=1 Tax=Aquibium sp. A9E412 TaxID=2976767 RepID=UPI0025B0F1F4|nr:PepSY domain-containing protein [Aquibium sp. A9E412]MDN2568121.1 PepSY domain-containing protein [Aquibium sp. A9E412]